MLTCFDVKEADEGCHETSDGHGAHELVAAVVGGEGEGTLAQMGQSLSDANHEKVVGVFGMILRQLPQHSSQAKIFYFLFSAFCLSEK